MKRLLWMKFENNNSTFICRKQSVSDLISSFSIAMRSFLICGGINFEITVIDRLTADKMSSNFMTMFRILFFSSSFCYSSNILHNRQSTEWNAKHIATRLFMKNTLPYCNMRRSYTKIHKHLHWLNTQLEMWCSLLIWCFLLFSLCDKWWSLEYLFFICTSEELDSFGWMLREIQWTIWIFCDNRFY